MKVFKNYQPKNRILNSGFTMIEVMIVVGIVLVLAGIGSVGYLNTLNRNRVATGVSIIKSQLLQARQSAVAMRQSRRVAIDAGELEGMPNDLSGQRLRRASVWVEGRQCEQFPFSGEARCKGGSNAPNAYQVTDEKSLPDGVTIAGLDQTVTPGVDEFPSLFYFEYNPRGQLESVYFEGQEDEVGPYRYPAVIHLIRDNERFEIDGENLTYRKIQGGIRGVDFSSESDNFQERFKVQTIEVVRLTGKVRTYPYGYQDPWPFDLPEIE